MRSRGGTPKSFSDIQVAARARANSIKQQPQQYQASSSSQDPNPGQQSINKFIKSDISLLYQLYYQSTYTVYLLLSTSPFHRHDNQRPRSLNLAHPRTLSPVPYYSSNYRHYSSSTSSSPVPPLHLSSIPRDSPPRRPSRRALSTPHSQHPTTPIHPAHDHLLTPTNTHRHARTQSPPFTPQHPKPLNAPPPTSHDPAANHPRTRWSHYPRKSRQFVYDVRGAQTLYYLQKLVLNGELESLLLTPSQYAAALQQCALLAGKSRIKTRPIKSEEAVGGTGHGTQAAVGSGSGEVGGETVAGDVAYTPRQGMRDDHATSAPKLGQYLMQQLHMSLVQRARQRENSGRPGHGPGMDTMRSQRPGIGNEPAGTEARADEDNYVSRDQIARDGPRLSGAPVGNNVTNRRNKQQTEERPNRRVQDHSQPLSNWEAVQVVWASAKLATTHAPLLSIVFALLSTQARAMYTQQVQSGESRGHVSTSTDGATTKYDSSATYHHEPAPLSPREASVLLWSLTSLDTQQSRARPAGGRDAYQPALFQKVVARALYEFARDEAHLVRLANAQDCSNTLLAVSKLMGDHGQGQRTPVAKNAHGKMAGFSGVALRPIEMCAAQSTVKQSVGQQLDSPETPAIHSQSKEKTSETPVNAAPVVSCEETGTMYADVAKLADALCVQLERQADDVAWGGDRDVAGVGMQLGKEEGFRVRGADVQYGGIKQYGIKKPSEQACANAAYACVQVHGHYARGVCNSYASKLPHHVQTLAEIMLPEQNSDRWVGGSLSTWQVMTNALVWLVEHEQAQAVTQSQNAPQHKGTVAKQPDHVITQQLSNRTNSYTGGKEDTARAMAPTCTGTTPHGTQTTVTGEDGAKCGEENDCMDLLRQSLSRCIVLLRGASISDVASMAPILSKAEAKVCKQHGHSVGGVQDGADVANSDMAVDQHVRGDADFQWVQSAWHEVHERLTQLAEGRAKQVPNPDVQLDSTTRVPGSFQHASTPSHGSEPRNSESSLRNSSTMSHSTSISTSLANDLCSVLWFSSQSRASMAPHHVRSTVHILSRACGLLPPPTPLLSASSQSQDHVQQTVLQGETLGKLAAKNRNNQTIAWEFTDADMAKLPSPRALSDALCGIGQLSTVHHALLATRAPPAAWLRGNLAAEGGHAQQPHPPQRPQVHPPQRPQAHPSPYDECRPQSVMGGDNQVRVRVPQGDSQGVGSLALSQPGGTVYTAREQGFGVSVQQVLNAWLARVAAAGCADVDTHDMVSVRDIARVGSFLKTTSSVRLIQQSAHEPSRSGEAVNDDSLRNAPAAVASATEVAAQLSEHTVLQPRANQPDDTGKYVHAGARGGDARLSVACGGGSANVQQWAPGGMADEGILGVEEAADVDGMYHADFGRPPQHGHVGDYGHVTNPQEVGGNVATRTVQDDVRARGIDQERVDEIVAESLAKAGVQRSVTLPQGMAASPAVRQLLCSYGYVNIHQTELQMLLRRFEQLLTQQQPWQVDAPSHNEYTAAVHEQTFKDTMEGMKRHIEDCTAVLACTRSLSVVTSPDARQTSESISLSVSHIINLCTTILDSKKYSTSLKSHLCVTLLPELSELFTHLIPVLYLPHKLEGLMTATGQLLNSVISSVKKSDANGQSVTTIVSCVLQCMGTSAWYDADMLRTCLTMMTKHDVSSLSDQQLSATVHAMSLHAIPAQHHAHLTSPSYLNDTFPRHAIIHEVLRRCSLLVDQSGMNDLPDHGQSQTHVASNQLRALAGTNHEHGVMQTAGSQKFINERSLRAADGAYISDGSGSDVVTGAHGLPRQHLSTWSMWVDTCHAALHAKLVGEEHVRQLQTFVHVAGRVVAASTRRDRGTVSTSASILRQLYHMDVLYRIQHDPEAVGKLVHDDGKLQESVAGCTTPVTPDVLTNQHVTHGRGLICSDQLRKVCASAWFRCSISAPSAAARDMHAKLSDILAQHDVPAVRQSTCLLEYMPPGAPCAMDVAILPAQHVADVDQTSTGALSSADSARDLSLGGVQGVAIEFDGPHHFTRNPANPRQRIGTDAWRAELFTAMGWRVVRVGYWEIGGNQWRGDTTALLKHKLQV